MTWDTLGRCTATRDVRPGRTCSLSRCNRSAEYMLVNTGACRHAFPPRAPFDAVWKVVPL